MSGLSERIRAYGHWRERVRALLRRHGLWLEQQSLLDGVTRSKLDGLMQRLSDERMTVAFVAEFSRGKSELINALFFAEYGKRVLPSSAGRTTMCPTELMHDPSQPACIRLLPIETRLESTALAQWRDRPQAWITVPFDAQDVDSVRKAFESVREVRKVSLQDAILMGLMEETSPGDASVPEQDQQVEVSRWRHAIANLPHPLLSTGLVVIDTPGLNALGSEPELTFSLLPSAHAVVFLLAADAGVTRSDIETWRERISPTHAHGRFVVLNKIDGLWDELRSPAEVDEEIEAQARSVARTLDIPRERVFPLSALKGLVARVNGDLDLLSRSRLTAFERALSSEIVPRRQLLVREQVRLESGSIASLARGALGQRRAGLAVQLVELRALKGRNREVIEQAARGIRQERASFDRSLASLKALHRVFARQEAELRSGVALARLKRHVQKARDAMQLSRMSVGLREAMVGLVLEARRDIESLETRSQDMARLMRAMSQRFSDEHGWELPAAEDFQVRRYMAEVERIEEFQRRHFGAISLITTEKWALTRRYFESVAVRLRAVYELASKAVDAWTAELMAPLMARAGEHEALLRSRLESVQRVLDAAGQLQVRIDQLEQEQQRINAQVRVLDQFESDMMALLAEAREPDRQAA
ncbi:MAG: dynamin family protein [Burkholderiaceae bacterium]